MLFNIPKYGMDIKHAIIMYLNMLVIQTCFIIHLIMVDIQHALHIQDRAENR